MATTKQERQLTTGCLCAALILRQTRWRESQLSLSGVQEPQQSNLVGISHSAVHGKAYFTQAFETKTVKTAVDTSKKAD